MSKEIDNKPFYNSSIPCDWEVKELGQIAKVTSGGTPSRDKKSFWGGNIPWITTSLIDFNEIESAEQFITEEGLKESSTKLFPPGTLLMALYGQGVTRGKTAILKIEATINQACAAIILDEKRADRQFVFQYLIGNYDNIRKLSNTGNQENLNGELVKSIKLNLPPLPEQKAIAHTLSLMDTAINKNNLFIAQKELQKKWLMQNLLTGKKRLGKDGRQKTGDGSWEEVRLGDLIKLASGDIKPSVTEKDNSAKYPFPIYGGNGIMAYSNIFNSDEERIIIGRVGEYCGITRKISGKCWITDNALFTTHITESISTEFLIYKLQFEDLSKLRSTGGQPLVSQKPIYNLSFSIPKSLNEQTTIAQVLQAADKEIQLLKTKTEKLREQKKGMMQVLLTGKKRVSIKTTNL